MKLFSRKRLVPIIILGFILIYAPLLYGAANETPVTGVALSAAESTEKTITLAVGAQTTLKPIFTPPNAKPALTWSSDNTGVATVSEKGIVKGIGVGSATITVTVLDGGYTATCKVNVFQAVTGVSLDYTKLTLKLGEADGVLTASIKPANATNQNVTWSSSNTKVATVSGTGTVKAVSPGTANITVTTEEGKKTAKCAVTVLPSGILTAAVSLDKTDVTIKVGATTDIQLTATVSPADASNKNVSWSSSNTKVATVSSTGLVKAVAPGKAVITVTTEEGKKTAKCNVTVPVGVTGISLKQSSLNLGIGAQSTLTAVVTPTNATEKTITWSSDNESVATVTEKGVVRGVSSGSATITATTQDGSYTATCIVNVIRAVSSISLDQTALTIKVGGADVQLTATINPADASNKNVTWSSSNTKIATVSGTGLVKAVAPGKAVISVTTEEGKKTAKCNVTVPVGVTGISLKQNTLALGIGAQSTLTAVVAPTNATEKTITWSSDNESVATVTEKGVVRGVSSGSATITATTQDGSYTATCIVNVIRAVSSISLDQTALTIKVGGADVQLTATINPADASNKNVTWSSSNTKIATVSGTGLVKAVAPGKAVISVTTEEGKKTAKCNVTVPVGVTGISLKQNTLALGTGAQSTLTAVVAPTNATEKTITWSSDNESVATVTEKGVVRGVSSGSAIITATTQDGSYTATCTVNVIHAVSSVSLDQTALTIKVGGADVQLTATINPADASNKNVSWSSSNTKIATVSSTGLVKAVAPGKAVITVTTEEGKKTAKCNVTVPVGVTGISLKQNTLALGTGAQSTLTAVVAPTNATEKTITWSSDNESVATVTEKGVVRGVSSGSATITATTQDGSYTATCTVNVIHAVSSVSLDQTALTIKVGSATDTQLTATVSPADATNKNVTWSSSNTKVATVSSTGLVKAVAPGKAVITVTTVDGKKTAKCNVAVPVGVTGISLKQSSLDLGIGAQSTLTAVIAPTNATDKTVTWSSDDTAVAIVNEKGVVKGLTVGDAKITATSKDGSYTATCEVNVIHAVSSVSLDKTDVTIKVGPTTDVQLTAAISPADASNTNVTWSSSNTKVATVNSIGLVKAIAPGKAVITVTTEEGKKTAKCNVTVPVGVTGISIKQSSLDLGIGAQSTLTAVIAPTNATEKAVTWSSDKPAVATVTEKGVVKGVAIGNATITATSKDGSYTATCTVNVIHAVSSVSLDQTALTIKAGGTDVQLTATINPVDATNKNVTWSSSNTKIATVSSTGLVKAIAPGKAVITVTTEEGKKSARCNVTVPVEVTGIGL